MAMCVEIQADLEEECGLSVILGLIPGKINKIPDYLSKGRIREAVDIKKTRRGVDSVLVELWSW